MDDDAIVYLSFKIATNFRIHQGKNDFVNLTPFLLTELYIQNALFWIIFSKLKDNLKYDRKIVLVQPKLQKKKKNMLKN